MFSFILLCQLERRLPLTVVSGLSSGSGEKPELNLVLFPSYSESQVAEAEIVVSVAFLH